ncbi:MAG: exodeoxyribonuclease V subunit alpha [Chthoniobacterales bacterium]|nr:exodeoxyribonuclease V subunit alpha [Chthoniobacterales bacterium]
MIEETSFSALDRQFGEFVERLHGAKCPELRQAAMLVSRRRAEGNICIPMVELPASCTVGSGAEFTPLVLQNGRLYLRRYWEYEQQLARAILARAGGKSPKRKLKDQQELAATNAVTRNFSVITGGPGTGKTHTVRAILQLLRAQPDGAELQIALAAPTGKAAARLSDALRESGLEATTIHRLLGTIPDSPYFRHNAERPLTADVVIVDEASMVDLALMAKLVEAVPLTSRLVLLGDRNQLASVEAGNVLADICEAAEAKDSPLHGSVVELQRNYRFAETGGIYTVSSAINAGDAEAAFRALQPADGEVHWNKLPAPETLSTALRERIIAGYGGYLRTSDPAAALAELQQFRILGAVRHGPFGVERLNSLAEEVLAEAGLLAPRSGWYSGRPVIITRNDHHLQLFNGDSGIILPDPEAGGELRAFFVSAEGKLRRFLPSRLPQHETAFALTVHKSQGSEFDRLLLVLPEKGSPVLTRELLYTGITRARSGVELWCNEEIFRAAVARRTVRTSGLREALARD